MENEKVTYEIPANYTESGRYLMDTVKGRNLAEMLVVGIPIILITYSLLSVLPLGVRLILTVIINAPILALFAIGLDEVSVGQYIWRMALYTVTSKKYKLERLNHAESERTEDEDDEEHEEEHEQVSGKKNRKQKRLGRRTRK